MNPARAGFRTQLKSEGKVAAYKELETTRKEKTNDPIADVKPGETKDISDNIGTTSPIGSK